MKLKRFSKFILALALLFFILYSLAGFSWKASFVLSISFCLLYVLLYAQLERLRQVLVGSELFVPFNVWIMPKWAALLRDYKLVKSDEQLTELFARAETRNAQFDVLRSGFAFTVLRPTPGWIDLRGLIYWDNRECYKSSVDLWGQVDGSVVNAALGDNWTPILEVAPNAFAKWGIDGGFDLGLEVNSDWWEQFCKLPENQGLAKVKTQEDHECGTVRLTMATLPYEEFGAYFGSENYSLERDLRGAQERDKALAKFGWKRQKERTLYPNEIEHKYFTVSHRAI